MLDRNMVKRKTFAAREDLLDRLSAFAKGKDLSLYGYVNDLFELVIKAESEGMNLSHLVEERELLSRARKAGFAAFPERLWKDLIEISYHCNEEETTRCWYETGVWLAKRYESNGVSDPVMTFLEDIGQFVWTFPKVDVTCSRDELVTDVSSPNWSLNRTVLYGTLLEGCFSVFGFEIVEKDIAMGNIHMRAART